MFYQFSLGSIKWVYVSEISNEYVTCVSFSAYWAGIFFLSVAFPFVPMEYIYIVMFLEAAATLPILYMARNMIETKGQDPDDLEEQMINVSTYSEFTKPRN